MPQGSMKKSEQGTFVSSLKSKSAKKKQTLRKGGHAIAPKKQKLNQKKKIEKAFASTLQTKIESELKSRAKEDGRQFHILNTPSTSQGAKK
jgi:hypothetical protein